MCECVCVFGCVFGCVFVRGHRHLTTCLVFETTGIRDVFLASDSLQFIREFGALQQTNASLYHGLQCAVDLRIYYNKECVRLEGYEARYMS